MFVSYHVVLNFLQTYCTAINFRDIMTALGRISADIITKDRIQQECVQGFEFTGRDNR